MERAVVEGQLVAADARLGRRVGALEGHPRPPEAAEVAEAGAGLDARKHLLEAGLLFRVCEDANVNVGDYERGGKVRSIRQVVQQQLAVFQGAHRAALFHAT